MSRQLIYACALLAASFSRCDAAAAAEEEELRYDKLYEDAVEAYLDERWDDCISKFEGALLGFRKMRDFTINCRVKCQGEGDESKPMFPENIEDLHHYEKLVKKTLCLMRCKKVLFQDKSDVISKEMGRNFENLKCYEYLQLCYIQKNLAQKAASAVFTFLVDNPEHETMLSNLKFYTSLPEVDVEKIVNLEGHPFVGLYVHGSEAYRNMEYSQVINYIEESLEEYLRAEEACRAFCEGPFDQGWFPDYTSSVANHFTYCLKCKRKCPLKLNTLNGERHDDLLPSHYHYLQFAYFQVGKLEKACEAAVSYLLFYPQDETMLSNLKYYKSLPEAEDEYFLAREEAIKYVRRDEYEKELLNFIDNKFISQEDEGTSQLENSAEFLQSKDSKQIGSMLQVKTKKNISQDGQLLANIPREGILEAISGTQFSKPRDAVDKHRENGWKTMEKPSVGPGASLNAEEKQEGERDAAEYSRSWGNAEEFTSCPNNKTPGRKENNDVKHGETIAVTDDERSLIPKRKQRKGKAEENSFMDAFLHEVKLVKSNVELTGINRFVAEGLAEENECKTMIELAQIAGEHGSGYGGNPSPYTTFETFQGMTIARAALMVYYGLIKPQVLDMFIDITDRGMHYLERHFDLNEKLYFDYSHLVCRTATANSKAEGKQRRHMSHPIHADNCIAQEDGTCRKINPPMYTWRDYSAIIYLNEDFEGGEFIFTGNLTEGSTQSVIEAKCGRMVGFSAGGENLHGVRGVISGRRCAIGLWFTLDAKHNEGERILAQILRDRLRTKGNISYQLLQELKHMSSFS